MESSVLLRPVPTAWALATLLAVGCTPPDGGPSERAFVERLGADTLAMETYQRTADGFEGEALVRSPVTRLVDYRATLDSEGTVERLEVEWRTPPENPDGPDPLSFVVTIEGDSATVEQEGGREPGTRKVAVPDGVIPTTGKVPMTLAVMEQAVRQALAAEGDSVSVDLLTAGRWQVMPNAVVRVAPDTVAVDFFGSPILVRIGEDGRILGRSGERTTLKIESEPAEGVDVEALAARYAALDARGEGMGVASPRATVEESVAGANLRVVYSRPAKRGREIWGGLVRWDEVWRTGANAATEFSSDRDLVIGGVDVPAGTYTLYSIFTPDSAQLIINQQTGQWGTVYDEDRDLARVELTRESAAEPVERFTIGIEPAEGGGRLTLTWDTTRYVVPFQVK